MKNKNSFANKTKGRTKSNGIIASRVTAIKPGLRQ